MYDPSNRTHAEPATLCTFDTRAVSTPNGSVTVLRVVGEVDLANVDLLRRALGCALAAHPAVLVVDLVALTFCSARGLTVIGQCGHTAACSGTGFAVAGPSPQLDRVWRAGWTDAERPSGFRTVADAVRAAPVHRVEAQDQAAPPIPTRIDPAVAPSPEAPLALPA